MKITLLVPTLNEIDGMKTFMPLVKPGWVDQILIVDGQSKDGTAEYARAQGYDVVIQKKRVCVTPIWKHGHILKEMLS